MKEFQGLLFRTIFAVLFISTAVNTFAQTSIQEYNREVNALANELKTKLEKIQHSNDRNATWRAAENALEDLKRVENFYLKPNCLSLNWDIETTRDSRTSEVIEVRAYEKPSHREPNYKKQFLVRVINKDGKGLYIMGNQSNFSPRKYYETSTITFYDPSGRKIKCRGRLLPFEDLKNLMKSSQCEVLYGRESTPGINVLNSGKNRPQGASYSNWPYAWLLKSSYTNEVVKLPFGTFWTCTPSNGGYKCITVDVMAASDYEETVLNKSDEAIGTYAFEIDYTQLLNWYKESLDYLMRDVNKFLGEQEAKEIANRDALSRAEQSEPLPSLLKSISKRILTDKNLFDYEIVANGDEYIIYARANSNTISMYEDFWKSLKSIKSDNSRSVTLWHRIPAKYDSYTQEELRLPLGTTDESHIYSLIKEIRKNSEENVKNFISATFNISKSDIASLAVDNSRYNDKFYIGVKLNDREPGERIPMLAYKPTKGDVQFGTIIKKSKCSIKSNADEVGYKVKIKK